MFKKILAVAAVTATAACLSVSAFAEGETATPAAPSASHNAGEVTVTGYAAVANATQYTVMVFKDDGFEITDPETGAKTYDASKIYYINQGAQPNVLLAGMLVKATDGVNALPDGDYTVRIGNNATGATAVDIDLKVSTDPETKEITFLWGDINLDGFVDANDITSLVYRDAGGKTTYTAKSNGVDFTFTIDSTSNGILWGDINLDGYVDANDITSLVYRDAGGKITYGIYTIDTNTTIEVK